MPLKSALFVTAALAGVACFAGQDPRLDYTFAAPNTDDPVISDVTVATSPALWATAVEKPSKKVSVSFKNVSAQDVFEWLKKQGLSFVAESETVGNKRVTLNIVDQPVRQVLEAVGAALGGHWEHRGEIYIYAKGAGSPFGTQTFGFNMVPPQVNAREIEIEGFPLAKAEGMPLREMEELKTKVLVPGRELSIEEAPLAELRALKIDGSKLDKEWAEKFAKELTETLKAANINDQATWQKFAKELQEGLSKHLGKAGPHAFVFGESKAAPAIKAQKAKKFDAEAFLKSITADQKAKQKAQGYLKLGDLTDAQKELLGVKDGAELTLELNIDGEKVVVKGK